MGLDLAFTSLTSIWPNGAGEVGVSSGTVGLVELTTSFVFGGSSRQLSIRVPPSELEAEIQSIPPRHHTDAYSATSSPADSHAVNGERGRLPSRT
jgi:hypothetical protein